MHEEKSRYSFTGVWARHSPFEYMGASFLYEAPWQERQLTSLCNDTARSLAQHFYGRFMNYLLSARAAEQTSEFKGLTFRDDFSRRAHPFPRGGHFRSFFIHCGSMEGIKPGSSRESE